MNEVTPKKGIGKKIGMGCLIVLGVFVALAILGAIVGGDSAKDTSNQTDSNAVSTEAAQAAVPVTAGELSAAFQENEAKAKLAYDGKTLLVSGKVKDIDLDFSDNPVIKLAGSGDVQGMGITADGKMTDVNVNGIPNEAAAGISKDATMSFLCAKITEVMGSPQLSECTIAP